MIAKSKTNSLSALEGDQINHALTPSLRKILSVKILGRPINFQLVTESEIENYAQFGWLATIFLTLFGTFAGFAGGFIIALIQGGISASSQVIFQWLSGATCFVSITFFVLAIVLVILQEKIKNRWNR